MLLPLLLVFINLFCYFFFFLNCFCFHVFIFCQRGTFPRMLGTANQASFCVWFLVRSQPAFLNALAQAQELALLRARRWRSVPWVLSGMSHRHPCLHRVWTQMLSGVKLMVMLVWPFPAVPCMCFDKKAVLYGGLLIIC